MERISGPSHLTEKLVYAGTPDSPNWSAVPGPSIESQCKHRVWEAGRKGAAREACACLCMWVRCEHAWSGPHRGCWEGWLSLSQQGPGRDLLPDPTPRGLWLQAPPSASHNKGFRADFIWITDRSLVCNQGGIHSLLQSHLKNISLYRNLQIDVNRHYFPSIFSPFPPEERKKSHPTR